LALDDLLTGAGSTAADPGAGATPDSDTVAASQS